MEAVTVKTEVVVPGFVSEVTWNNSYQPLGNVCMSTAAAAAATEATGLDCKNEINTPKEKITGKRKVPIITNLTSMKLPVVMPIDESVRKRRKSMRPRRKAPTKVFDDNGDRNEEKGEADSGDTSSLAMKGEVYVDTDTLEEAVVPSIQICKDDETVNTSSNKTDDLAVKSKQRTLRRTRTCQRKTTEELFVKNKDTVKKTKRKQTLKSKTLKPPKKPVKPIKKKEELINKDKNDDEKLDTDCKNELDTKSEGGKDKVVKVVGKRCNICNKEFPSRKNAMEHYSKQHANDLYNYICKDCNKVFKTKYGLKGHNAYIHTSQECLCDKCGKSFRNNAHVERHVRVVHKGERNYKCSWCDKYFADASNKKKHECAIHLNVRNHHCHVCGYKFKNKSALSNHLYTIHTEPAKKTRFECTYCNKVFYSKSHLQNHTTVHQDLKNFPCRHEGCDKKFRLSCNRKKHEQTHDDIRPYSCDICSQTFSRKAYLDTHQYKHTGVKLFQCSICCKGFSQKGNLTVHMSLHKEERVVYPCPVCHRSFSHKTNLSKHLLLHSNPKDKHATLYDKATNTRKQALPKFLKSRDLLHVLGNNRIEEEIKKESLNAAKLDESDAMAVVDNSDKVVEKNEEAYISYECSSGVVTELEDHCEIDSVETNMAHKEIDVSAKDELSKIETSMEINKGDDCDIKHYEDESQSCDKKTGVKQVPNISPEKEENCSEVPMDCNKKFQNADDNDICVTESGQTFDDDSEKTLDERNASSDNFLNVNNNPGQTTGTSAQLFFISSNADEAEILQDFLEKCNPQQVISSNVRAYDDQNTLESVVVKNESLNTAIEFEPSSPEAGGKIQLPETILAGNKSNTQEATADNFKCSTSTEEIASRLSPTIETPSPEMRETLSEDNLHSTIESLTNSLEGSDEGIVSVSENIGENIHTNIESFDELDDSDRGTVNAAESIDEMLAEAGGSSSVKSLFIPTDMRDMSMITVSVKDLDAIIENT